MPVLEWLSKDTESGDVRPGGVHQRYEIAKEAHLLMSELAGPALGELDICGLCENSPHSVACPRHANYDDDRFTYAGKDESSDVGTARYWTEETFAAAALDAGDSERAAQLEGIAEFSRALRDGWIVSAR